MRPCEDDFCRVFYDIIKGGVLMEKLFTKKILLEIFDYLNDLLFDNKLYLELTVYGGSIMTLLYDNRPATKDIDSLFNTVNDELLKNIFKQIQDVYQLNNDWINDDVKGPIKTLIEEETIIYREYSNLTIVQPIPEQLLAMKVLAARAEPSKDFVDAYILCRDLNITEKNQLFDIVTKFIPRKALKERQLTFIKYLGEDLGYDWS